MDDYTNKQKKNKLIFIYTLISFLHTLGMSFFASNMILYMESKEMTLFEIGIVSIIIMVVVFILEIPSGAYSDSYGRKKTYIISTMGFIVGYLLYYSADNKYFFMIGALFVSLGLSFKSGSLESWFVDKLNDSGEDYSLEKIYANISIWVQLSSIVGGVIGAFTAEFYGLSSPWLLSIFTMLLILIITIFFIEDRTYTDNSKSDDLKKGFNKLKNNIVEGYYYCINNKVIINIFGISILASFASATLVTYWQIFFSTINAKNNIIIMGYIWIFISLARIFGGLLIKFLLDKKFNTYLIWAISNILSGTVLMLIYFISNMYIALVFYLFHYFGQSMVNPILSAKLNENIIDKKRSTVLSIYSLVGQIGQIIGLLINGKIADYSLSLAWAISGAAIVGSVIFINNIRILSKKAITL